MSLEKLWAAEEMVEISFHAAYGGIALFISLLNNIFLLYYVDTFVNIYKIDSKSFWIGEVNKETFGFPFFILIVYIDWPR